MHMQQIRCLCTSSRLQAIKSSTLGKIAYKVMNTDITKKSSKKKGGSPINFVLPAVMKKEQTHKSRRTTVLNKLFMVHISDLMATGEVAPSLVGRGIEITHVNVAADFSIVNVYWIAADDRDLNVSTEKVLGIAAGHLQHELSQLRVIGRVPPINFVRNKRYGSIQEVENRLAKVDFGEDFEPSAHIIPQNRAPILRTSVSEKIKQQLRKLMEENALREKEEKEGKEKEAAEEVEDDEANQIQVPEMRQNVMGFDHSYVLSKVKLSLGKIKAAEERAKLNLPEFPQGSKVNEDETSTEVATFLSNNKDQDMNIDDFIRKRNSDDRRRKRALPYYESKLEDEFLRQEKTGSECVDDLIIDDVVSDNVDNKI